MNAQIDQPKPLRVQLCSGRVQCPSCGKKGLGYANHPHGLGWKDYERARCRYCHKTFKIKPRAD